MNAAITNHPKNCTGSLGALHNKLFRSIKAFLMLCFFTSAFSVGAFAQTTTNNCADLTGPSSVCLGAGTQIYILTSCFADQTGNYAINLLNNGTNATVVSTIVNNPTQTTVVINTGTQTGNYVLSFTTTTNVAFVNGTKTAIGSKTTAVNGADANAGPDRAITCTSGPSVALAGSTTTPGSTFAWAASGGGNIVSGANTLTPTVNAAGTYTLTVTGPTGCTATDVAMVTLNNTPPNANAGVDKVINCTTGPSIQLSGSSSTAGVTFAWVASGGGNIVSGANTATPTVNAAGTYTLTVTNPANGCTATDAAAVTLNTTPPNANAGPDRMITCLTGPSIILAGSSTTAGATFAWVASGGGNIVSGANTATPTVNAAGTYTLTVTNPANGCTATDFALVTLNNTPPNASAGVDKEILCGGTTVVLSGSSTTAGATFAWVASNGGVIVSGAATATPTVSAAGTYTLTVTNPANGCTATDAAIVTVQPCVFDGCSPGFWKNHEELWDNLGDAVPLNIPVGLRFTTTTLFRTYFNLSAAQMTALGFPQNITMHGVISQGGGGCKSFGRHAVAALLTAGSGLNIDWPDGIAQTYTALYTAIRNTFISGDCQSTFAAQVAKISDDDHENCGRVIPVRVTTATRAAILERVENSSGEIAVSSFPNPYSDNVRFNIESSVTGRGVLEVYNLVGQKIQTVFEGTVHAGKSQAIQYNIPAQHRSSLIYRFRVGDKEATGKLFKAN